MSFELTREQIYRREDQIPAVIMNIGRSNVLVSNIINRFVLGQIVTWDEAMSQMIVGLATNWEDVMKKNYELSIDFMKSPFYTPPPK